MKTKTSLIIAIVIVFDFARIAGATLVDSNSIIEDDIEYYVQTDKFVYDLGEVVEMLYRVTNLGDEDVTFGFNVGPVDDRGDFIVEKDGERIWDNLERPCIYVGTYFTLSSLESKEFSWSWDTTDFSGHQVVPGDYDATGVLSDLSLAYIERYVPVSVPIEIIPEPGTMALFGMGLVGLLAYNRKNKK